MNFDSTPELGRLILAEADRRPGTLEQPPHPAEAGAEMLFQRRKSRNLGVFRTGRFCAVIASAVGCLTGCHSPDRSLQVWKQAAHFEHVSRFQFEPLPAGGHWFARILESRRMPAVCIYPLSDRFDFVILRTPDHWNEMVRATNLDLDIPTPDFSRGVVVGLTARVGETRSDRWPALITTVRQRGRVAFIQGEFRDGFYRPLAVPPYLHLVYVPEVDTFLGVKLNHLLYGFNVEIDDLNAAGIR